MIRFEPGKLIGISFVFALKGSVLPRAFVWALAGGILGVIVHSTFKLEPADADALVGTEKDEDLYANIRQVFATILSFLVVFKAQMAYQRYWEGATLLRQAQGNWLDATGNALAFCSRSKEMTAEVQRFQSLLVKLMSLLYCASLQELSGRESLAFETVDLTGLDLEGLSLLDGKSEKGVAIMQWIHRLLADSAASGIISAPPPVFSRVFQQLGQGNVIMTDARKLQEVPFPFPFEQCLAVMMLFATVAGSFQSGLYASRVSFAFLAPFIALLSYWSVYYTGTELAMPFRDSANGLDISEHQREMNRNLHVLLISNDQDLPDCPHSPGGSRKISLTQTHLQRLSVEHIPSKESADVVQQDSEVKLNSIPHVSEAQQQIRDTQFDNKPANRPNVYTMETPRSDTEFIEPVLPVDPIQVTCRIDHESSFPRRSSQEDLGLAPIEEQTWARSSAHHSTETSVCWRPDPETAMGSLRGVVVRPSRIAR